MVNYKEYLMWFENLQKINYTKKSPNGIEFCVVLGKYPILLSAPHATAHIRFGVKKDPDNYTGAIASLIQKETNSHLIYTTYLSTKDPSGTMNSPYKEEVKKVLKENPINLVLDFHGMAYEGLDGVRPEVCPGTGYNFETLLGKFNYLKKFEEVLKDNGIDVRECKFMATEKTRIAQFCAKLGVPSIQIEIRKDLRDPENEKCILLVKSLIKYVKEICEVV